MISWLTLCLWIKASKNKTLNITTGIIGIIAGALTSITVIEIYGISFFINAVTFTLIGVLFLRMKVLSAEQWYDLISDEVQRSGGMVAQQPMPTAPSPQPMPIMYRPPVQPGPFVPAWNQQAGLDPYADIIKRVEEMREV